LSFDGLLRFNPAISSRKEENQKSKFKKPKYNKKKKHITTKKKKPKPAGCCVNYPISRAHMRSLLEEKTGRKCGASISREARKEGPACRFPGGPPAPCLSGRAQPRWCARTTRRSAPREDGFYSRRLRNGCTIGLASRSRAPRRKITAFRQRRP